MKTTRCSVWLFCCIGALIGGLIRDTTLDVTLKTCFDYGFALFGHWLLSPKGD